MPGCREAIQAFLLYWLKWQKQEQKFACCPFDPEQMHNSQTLPFVFEVSLSLHLPHGAQSFS